MTKLNLIGSIGATYSDREFHLEELVRLCPDHLKFKDVMHLLDTEVVSCQRFSKISSDIINVLKYLCVELDVRTHGVQDNLLCDSALITDP